MHHSIKMTPIETSKKSNEKFVFSNLQNKREKQKQNYKIGCLVRTADVKKNQ